MGRNIPAILFISGVALIFFALIQGEAKAGFFVIFPYISGNGIFTTAGIFLIMVSIGIFIFSSFIREDVTIDHQAGLEYKKKRTGGIIFVGPIPIVIANNQQTAIFMAVIALVVLLLFAAIMLQMFYF